MAKTSRPETKLKSALPTRPSGSEVPTIVPLNFKVPKEFRREFKTFASQHDMKMVALLQEGFRLAKEHLASGVPDSNDDGSDGV